jgi:hypothetical protein
MKISEILAELEKWSQTYEFSFQFWGDGNNNVYIAKGGVDLYDTGGYNTILEAIWAALEWVYAKNPKAKKLV